MENEIFQEPKISKAYLRLSLPLVFSMVVTLIYNLADTYFVAQTNDTNIVAGVSLGMPVFTLLMALGNIFGQGGTSLISRLFGQKDRQGMEHASSFCFYITGFLGILIAGFMLIFRIPLLHVIGASTETFAHASDYYIYLAIGAPAVMLSFIHSNFLRSEGMSKESMAGTVLGAVINIILDPVFISVLGLGASGAAIATVIGYDKIAAMGIVLKVNMIALLLLTGFAFGGQPLFGYYYGSNDKKRLSKLLRFCFSFISIIAAALTAIIFVAAPFLMKCFMDNESIITDGTDMLRWQVITMVLVGVILLMTIIFQSMGKVAGSFILSVSRQGIVFLITLVIAYRTLGYMGIILSQAVADLLTAIIAILLFKNQLSKEFHYDNGPLNV
ncbi:MAG: MATE family efflux transporter [Lachnospiraceae bacterium]|nr:MATE family efflux transporter [Lachnospiraceae bacterium]